MELNLCLMCMSDDPIPVCNLLLSALLRETCAILISSTNALESAHIIGLFTFFDISTTELKSPGLDIGKPASIISTPRSSKSNAISTFSSVFN